MNRMVRGNLAEIRRQESTCVIGSMDSASHDEQLARGKSMKLPAKFNYFHVAVISVAILTVTLFSITQLHTEASRQAKAMQQSHLMTFWELLREKGRDFKIVSGKMLVGNYVLNGNNELPDKVKEIFGGTATIFMGDIRISTNVLQEDGRRAIGTRLEGPAYDALFRQGRSYRGEVIIFGVPYFAAYDPIRNSEGKVIGALYVGVRKSDFFAAYDRLAINQAIVAGLLIALLTAFGILPVRQRKEAESALRESEERLKSILQGSPIPQFIIDRDHRILFWNRALEMCTGLKSEEMIGTSNHWKAFYPESHPCLADLLVDGNAEAIQDWYPDKYSRSGLMEDAYEVTDFFPLLGKTGKWLYITATLVRNPRNEVICAVETLEDITARKDAEEELRQSDEKFRCMTASAASGIIMIDSEGRITLWNDAAERIFGWTASEAHGRDVHELLAPPCYHEMYRKAFPEFRDTGRGTLVGKHLELVSLRRDGDEFPIQLSLSPVRLRGRWHALAIISDISVRKQAENDLQEHLHFLQELIDAMPNPVFFKNTTGLYLGCNKAYEEFIGVKKRGIIGKSVYTVHPKELADQHDASDRDLLSSASGVQFYEASLPGADGACQEVIFNQAVFTRKDGTVGGIVGIILDLTEQRRMEREVMKIQKLDSLGVLAGGIAHDFNNLLTGIMGNISLAKMSVPPDSKAYRRLDEAERASERARGLTYQLLTFSKGGAPIKKIASIGPLVLDSCSFALRGSNVRCEYYISEDIRPVEVDEGQMGQVIHNLIINAAQAMPEGGLVRVSVENVAEGPRNVRADRGLVRISIQDNGVGIPEEALPRIFDPYFTTKPKGSGLGLATVYSIIKNHDGGIEVDSRAGEGTVFHLYLPASEKILTQDMPEAAEPVAGMGRILLMDDEDVVRDVGSELLSALGYSVTICGDGVQMISLYRSAIESGKAFDAVIMDLTVPGGMGGKEAMDRLLEIDPEVKGIVSSGYNNDPILSSYRDYGFRGVVTKPYTLIELGDVLHAVLYP